ncbi:hypothetical protein NIES2135_61670 (plasmid) [Leptolyngbya boryana NIES-2135]|jgi:hypothetical protein|uniref:Uncharacterized protein n=1 Tax=Leptolyngbya boryana NIES-2135 TaxID=1973484 RepID=A0A1Z4JRF0_LEPBY|nr:MULTISPECIES: hypothetical protein [Leptolyngbya]BAY59290.1 hypothetical protein NIES2135_61670 [Leptolyngbya boryana NIES-2135]MBD2372878.1 hypothetical protein [Leptolyngbya sp. FACHB-238]MBD2397369.1 hypothetical protein [Leptolyngbya sp. FACHB-239]MBD2403826.1 hypothetical protein [Leptolyngbya sp. FACHB-402]ULP33482.1 hypothetical protein MCP04_30600 [Leptolyngbya boryana IU 594]
MNDSSGLSRLSNKQKEALGSIYCGDTGRGYAQKTLDSLEKKGLIVSQTVAERQGVFVFTHKEYYVPLSVHYEVTQYFAAQYDQECEATFDTVQEKEGSRISSIEPLSQSATRNQSN